MLSVCLLAIFSVLPASPAESKEYSARWLEAGLKLRIQDSSALLDSVEGFRFLPPLAFPIQRIEERKGASIIAQPGEPETLNTLYWGQNASIAFHFDPTSVRLDPQSGALDFPRLFGLSPELELVHLAQGTSRPRRPVSAHWKQGSWSTAPFIGNGAGLISVPVRIGASYAFLRIDEARWDAHGWSLGTGPHLIEWFDGPAVGMIDTLRGPLRLELADENTTPSGTDDSLDPGPSRIIGYGGGSGMRENDYESSINELRNLQARIVLKREARGLALRGAASWHAWRLQKSGRFTDGDLKMDTAYWNDGTRILRADVAADGSPIRGTLLDTLFLPISRGFVRFTPGTRLVQGLPALGGAGERFITLNLENSGYNFIGEDSLGQIADPLQAGSASTRQTNTMRRLAFRSGGLLIEGRLGIERQEQDGMTASLPDRFVPILDSITVRLPGLTDTLGVPADIVMDRIGSEEIFSTQEGSASWEYWGPWRQWVDTATPWLVWRFRPGLGRYGTQYYLRAESLMVAWKGGPFRPTYQAKGYSLYQFMNGGFRCRSEGKCPVIELPVPATHVIGSPWPGLGKFHDNISLVRLTDTLIRASMTLRPSRPWQPLLGSTPITVDVRVQPTIKPDRSWGLLVSEQPALVVHFKPGQLYAKAGVYPLAPEPVQLSTPEGKLVFQLDWQDRFQKPVFLGAPVKNAGTARLTRLFWSGNSRGDLDSSQSSWEPLVRPLSYSLPDASELRGIEPLQLTFQLDGSKLRTKVQAKGLVVVRKGKAYSLTSPVSLDHEGNLMDVTNSEVVAFPTLPPREGRVSVTLEDGTTLNVDRNEVTRRAWKQCVEAGPCRVISQDSCGKKRFYGDSNDSLRQVRTQSWRSLDPMPVTCILHEDAETFCRWSSGRLPTAEEYQRLVQVALKTSKTPSDQYWPINTLGIDRISNPWQPGGDDPFADLAPSGSLRPLNPGIYDLGGNADELCTSSGRAVGNTPYEFTCRTPNQIGSSSRALKSNQGFRCVDK